MENFEVIIKSENFIFVKAIEKRNFPIWFGMKLLPSDEELIEYLEDMRKLGFHADTNNYDWNGTIIFQKPIK